MDNYELLVHDAQPSNICIEGEHIVSSSSSSESVFQVVEELSDVNCMAHHEKKKSSPSRSSGVGINTALLTVLVLLVVVTLVILLLNTYVLWKRGLLSLSLSNEKEIRISVVSHYGSTLKVKLLEEDTLLTFLVKASAAAGVPYQYVALERHTGLVKDLGKGPSRERASKDIHAYTDSLQHSSRLTSNIYTYRSPEANQSLHSLHFDFNEVFQLLLRPLRGDHLHYSFSIYVNGRLLKQIYDRPVQEWIYEGRHLEQVYPHWGLHAGHLNYFSDSLMHIHPATSWQWFFHSEGLGANLGAFLEGVGVWIWEDESIRYPNRRPFSCKESDAEYEVVLDFPKGLQYNDSEELVLSNCDWSPHEYKEDRVVIWPKANMTWRLFYWPHYADNQSYSVVDRGFERIWLYQNQGRIVLSYDDGSFIPPASSEATQRELDKYGTGIGFDGRDYPACNIPGYH